MTRFPAHTASAAIDAERETAPWFRHRWPWLLMTGPAAVVVAGAITGWLAWAQQDAVVVDDYYRQGKAINQDLRRDRTAASLGAAAWLSYAPANSTLDGSVAFRNGSASREFRVSLVHATHPERDIRLYVVPDAEGRFSVALPFLEKSRWKVQIEGAAPEWRLQGTWIWPQQREITLSADPV